MDFHRYRFGSPGPYNRVTVQQDVRTVLQDYPPDEVYTTSHFDTHPDHQATALFLTDALVALKRSGAALSTKLYEGIVWRPLRLGTTGPRRAGVLPAFLSRRRRCRPSSSGSGRCVPWCPRT